jgi:hypothetical protein
MRSYIIAAAMLAAAATPVLADCKSDLDAILKAQLATPYRVEMTSTANGATTKVNAEVIFPGSFRIKADSMEMVMVGKKTWMNMGGAWQAMPPEAAAMMAQMIESGVSKGIAGVKNVECLGSKDYEGSSFDAYSFSTSGEAMGISSTADVTLYATDGMPAWLVVDGEAMGTKSTTVQKITFDPSITISPPQ